MEAARLMGVPLIEGFLTWVLSIGLRDEIGCLSDSKKWHSLRLPPLNLAILHPMAGEGMEKGAVSDYR
jgi:hypothetical protein